MPKLIHLTEIMEKKQMRFFDTHIHLQDFRQPVEAVITQAEIYNIEKVIAVSSVFEDWDKINDFSAKFPTIVVPAFGLHPWYVFEKYADELQKLEVFLQKNPQALIGECGLDGTKSAVENQTGIFLRQIELAKKYSRAMIIHCVKAQQWFQNNWNLLPEKFVFHSYNGKKEFLKQILNHGGYVGFNASIFRNREAKEILKYMPRDKILLETDAPYQGFEKGKMNTISSLPEIFYGICELLEENAEILAKQIYKNSEEFVKNDGK